MMNNNLVLAGGRVNRVKAKGIEQVSSLIEERDADRKIPGADVQNSRPAVPIFQWPWAADLAVPVSC